MFSLAKLEDFFRHVARRNGAPWPRKTTELQSVRDAAGDADLVRLPEPVAVITAPWTTPDATLSASAAVAPVPPDSTEEKSVGEHLVWTAGAATSGADGSPLPRPPSTADWIRSTSPTRFTGGTARDARPSSALPHGWPAKTGPCPRVGARLEFF